MKFFPTSQNEFISTSPCVTSPQDSASAEPWPDHHKFKPSLHRLLRSIQRSVPSSLSIHFLAPPPHPLHRLSTLISASDRAQPPEPPAPTMAADTPTNIPLVIQDFPGTLLLPLHHHQKSPNPPIHLPTLAQNQNLPLRPPPLQVPRPLVRPSRTNHRPRLHRSLLLLLLRNRNAEIILPFSLSS